MSAKTPLDALKEAITVAGSQQALADAITTDPKKPVRQSHISLMVTRDGKASAKYASKISKVTGVPKHELRPDLYDVPDLQDVA